MHFTNARILACGSYEHGFAHTQCHRGYGGIEYGGIGRVSISCPWPASAPEAT